MEVTGSLTYEELLSKIKHCMKIEMPSCILLDSNNVAVNSGDFNVERYILSNRLFGCTKIYLGIMKGPASQNSEVPDQASKSDS